MLLDEAALVTERENAKLVTAAQLHRDAVAALFSKKAGSSFDKIIRSINVEARFRSDEALPRLGANQDE